MKKLTHFWSAIAIVMVLEMLVISPGFAQVTIGPNNAGTGVNVTGIGAVAWSNPGNITTPGSPYATVTLSPGQNSNYLRGTGYGFSIPSNATILGIQVAINRSGQQSLGFGFADNALYLVKNDVVQTGGNNKAITDVTWPTSLGTANYGTTSDLWGLTWTPADINNAGFGVAFSVHSNLIFSTLAATVNYIQVTVTYQSCVNPDIPTLSASDNPICLGQSTTLSIASGSLGDATEWHWYTGSCGGTEIGTGPSVNVSPETTTTYYLRGEGGCVIPGTCAEISVIVNELPSAVITGSTVICAGNNATLSVALTGTPPWSYTWSDGTGTGTVSNVLSTPSTFTVNPLQTKTYTILTVTDGNDCSGNGSGSAKVDIGPVTLAPELSACAGDVIAVPITVKNFSNVGAISLTLKYTKSVLTYNTYENTSGLIEEVYFNENGPVGVVRFSGISQSFYQLNDDDVLITLVFNYLGGYSDLTWDDSDDIQCEYATGAPNFIPYCDDDTDVYYHAGSVTDVTVQANFSATNLAPPRFTDVQLTDLSTGATSWEWSFDRPSVTYVGGTTSLSQNPIVQFTEGGLYTVTLKAGNANCEDTEVKTGYIRAGMPGLWSGNTDNDWYTPTNWDNHLVPAGNTNVMIPGVPEGGNFPFVPNDLETTEDCLNIILEGPAIITVQGEFIVNDGTQVIITGTGQVIMNFVPGP